MESVLFVCTHNSARSQMAEGLLRDRFGDRYNAFSAGTEPGGVNPLAVEAMDELGIDIRAHSSKHIDVYGDLLMDYVVTVCDSAKEACPFVRSAIKSFHQSFPDPSAVQGSHGERLAAFRAARDSISRWIDATFGSASPGPAS